MGHGGRSSIRSNGSLVWDVEEMNGRDSQEEGKKQRGKERLIHTQRDTSIGTIKRIAINLHSALLQTHTHACTYTHTIYILHINLVFTYQLIHSTSICLSKNEFKTIKLRPYL